MTEKDLQKLYEESLNAKKDDKTVTGTVIQVSSKGEIFVDFKYKADGIIPKAEIYTFFPNFFFQCILHNTVTFTA